MRTVDEIKAEIRAIRSNYPGHNDANDDMKMKRRDRQRVLFLYDVQLYLESGPREQFVKDQILDQEKRLLIIDRDFPAWCDSRIEKLSKEEHRKKYNKEMNVSEINKKIKTLRFILS